MSSHSLLPSPLLYSGGGFCSKAQGVRLTPCPHLLLTLQPLPIVGFPDYKKGEPKHGKRKRGRPRKLSKEYWDCLEGKKSKHGKFLGVARPVGGGTLFLQPPLASHGRWNLIALLSL